MIENEVLEKIKIFTLQKIPPDDINGYGHTERVYHLCIKFGLELGANLLVLKSAALLHDVGRYSEDPEHLNKNHANISAKIASNFLRCLEFQFNKTDFDNIIHCIQAHSFSNQISPKTLEAQILSDIDKLDALGAVGLYRTIGYTTKMNGNLQDVLAHIESKIFKLKKQLFLDISKVCAQDRDNFIKKFYQEVKLELKLQSA